LDIGKTTDRLPFKVPAYFSQQKFILFLILSNNITEFNHSLEIVIGYIQRTMAERFVARNHICIDANFHSKVLVFQITSIHEYDFPSFICSNLAVPLLPQEIDFAA